MYSNGQIQYQALIKLLKGRDKDRNDSKWITSRDATASGNTQNFCYPFPRPKYLFLSVGTQFPENLRPASVATFALTQGGGYGGRPSLCGCSASQCRKLSQCQRSTWHLQMGISYSVHLLCALSTMCTLSFGKSTSSQGDGSSMIACGAIQGILGKGILVTQ